MTIQQKVQVAVSLAHSRVVSLVQAELREKDPVVRKILRHDTKMALHLYACSLQTRVDLLGSSMDAELEVLDRSWKWVRQQRLAGLRRN